MDYLNNLLNFSKTFLLHNNEKINLKYFVQNLIFPLKGYRVNRLQCNATMFKYIGINQT